MKKTYNLPLGSYFKFSDVEAVMSTRGKSVGSEGEVVPDQYFFFFSLPKQIEAANKNVLQ